MFDHPFFNVMALNVALISAFFVPPPWHIPVGIAANLVWVWRL